MVSNKFYGKIGYNHGTLETFEGSGVYELNITEQSYFGDVTRMRRTLRDGEQVISDLQVNNAISIVADAYANEHFHAIQYAEWAGTLWKVASVTVEGPRLILELGGVYNGPTSGATPDP